MDKPITLEPAPGALTRAVLSLSQCTIQEYAIEVGTLASGSSVVIPVVVVKGNSPGPCLWINGQVHGDEINGVRAALKFVRQLALNELSGSVVVTATANPHALNARRKRTPFDDLDLDQCFPGHDSGLVSERLAAALTVSMERVPDALVSFHTMGMAFDCEPFAVFKAAPNDALVSESQLLDLMRHFRPSCACFMPMQLRAGELPGHLEGAIDYWMLGQGKPAFMIELGAGGRLEQRHVAQGVAGLRGMAEAMAMLPATSDGSDDDTGQSLTTGTQGGCRVDSLSNQRQMVRVNQYQHVTCSHGGLFERLVEPDTELAANEVYGRVLDLYGREIERLSFDSPVRLIGVRRDPVVHSGDRVAFVARKWHTVNC